jgi:hypothetical protein
VWVEGSARLLCSHFYMLKSKAFLIELVSQIQFGESGHIASEDICEKNSNLRESITRFYSAGFSLMILFPLLYTLSMGFKLMLSFFESAKTLEVPHRCQRHQRVFLVIVVCFRIVAL